MPVSSDCADWDANPPYNGCVPVVARRRNRAFHIWDYFRQTFPNNRGIRIDSGDSVPFPNGRTSDTWHRA